MLYSIKPKILPAKELIFTVKKSWQLDEIKSIESCNVTSKLKDVTRRVTMLLLCNSANTLSGHLLNL